LSICRLLFNTRLILFTLITIADFPEFLKDVKLNSFRALMVARSLFSTMETEVASTPVITKRVNPVVDASATTFGWSSRSWGWPLRSF
jgi:hypothetical protein